MIRASDARQEHSRPAESSSIFRAMSAPINERLSAALADRYRFDRRLGEGGMATVYLAEDLKHDRKVAIKVLKPELAAVLGADRFVVEIKTTAALSHPHILPLFDSGTADGFLYYVMPFIKGETIREKLNRETQFGVEEAVRIAREVADALDYAHRNGVIHRDIKPENILLHDGRAMVMDFGIALAVSAAAGGRMTETGLSLGTPHYMSPEQATADKEITGRSDVYSLASILYEMLAGVPPHEGGSAQQVIMRIIADTPRPVTDLRKSVPPNVAAALSKALEKLPADRFESARSFADALSSPSFTVPGRRTVARSGLPAIRQGSLLPWSIAGLAVVVASVLALRPRASGDPAGIPVFASLDVEGIGMSGIGGSQFSVSPDGRRVAIVLQRDAVGLAVRSLDSASTRFLARTRGATHPFWSPDSKSIGFFMNDSLKTVDLASETVRTICAARFANGGSWSHDGTIMFGTRAGILTGSATANQCSVRMSDVMDGSRTLQPYFFPDGRHFIATGDQRVWLGDLERPDSLVLLRDLTRSEAVFVAPDILLWRATDAILAQRVDVRARRLIGEPVRVLPRTRNPGGHTALSVSETGVVVASFVKVNDEAPDGSQIGIVDRAGTELHMRPIPAGVWSGLRLSRSGQRLALGGWNIQAMTLASSRWQRIAGSAETGKETSTRAVWSPGDTAVLFVQAFSPPVLRAVSMASGTVRTITEVPFRQRSTQPAGTGGVIGDWSPDGRRIATTIGREVWEYDFATDSARRLFDAGSPLADFRYHPGGAWATYTQSVEGSTDVFVRPILGTGEPIRISSDGGRWPRWNARGSELFYVDERENVIAVPVRFNSRLVPGTPAIVVPAAAFSTHHPTEFDVAPDGQRFYFIVSSDTRSLDLVLNWRLDTSPRRSR